jgi:hypothetical protein
MVHRLLCRPGPCREEGADSYRPTDTDRLKEQLVHRLRKLGYSVTVTPEEPAA